MNIPSYTRIGQRINETLQPIVQMRMRKAEVENRAQYEQDLAEKEDRRNINLENIRNQSTINLENIRNQFKLAAEQRASEAEEKSRQRLVELLKQNNYSPEEAELFATGKFNGEDYKMIYQRIHPEKYPQKSAEQPVEQPDPLKQKLKIDETNRRNQPKPKEQPEYYDLNGTLLTEEDIMNEINNLNYGLNGGYSEKGEILIPAITPTIDAPGMFTGNVANPAYAEAQNKLKQLNDLLQKGRMGRVSAGQARVVGQDELKLIGHTEDGEPVYLDANGNPVVRTR